MDACADNAGFIGNFCLELQTTSVNTYQFGFTLHGHSYRGRGHMADVKLCTNSTLTFFKDKVRHYAMRSSIKAIIAGVAKTASVPLPTEAAVYLSLTLASMTFFIPISINLFICHVIFM